MESGNCAQTSFAMLSIRAILKYACFVVLITTACSLVAISSTSADSKPGSTPTSIPAAGVDFANAWLHEEQNGPIQWHGIQPGNTQAEEALELLSLVPEITYIEKVTGTTESNFPDNILWDIGTGDPRVLGGIVYYHPDIDIVDSLAYSTAGSIALQDVIDAIGQPSHIGAEYSVCHLEPCTASYSVSLYYLGDGVKLQWGGRLEEGQIAEMHSQIRYFHVVLFDPGSDLGKTEAYGDTIQPWDGFKELEEYCANGKCDRR